MWDTLSNTNKRSRHNQPPANTCETLSIDWRRHQDRDGRAGRRTDRDFYLLLLSAAMWQHVICTCDSCCIHVCVCECGCLCICLAISKLLCSIRVALRTPRQTTSSLRAPTKTPPHHHHQHHHHLATPSTTCASSGRAAKVLRVKCWTEEEAFHQPRCRCVYVAL